MQKSANSISNKIASLTCWPDLAVLLALIACQALWFGPIISKVGFYLDDWATYSDLFNGQQNFGWY